jgi:glutathione S-transferase
VSDRLIYHLALARDWDAAQAVGRYAVSTLGRTLQEEGFIHASRADQWAGVRESFYAGVSEPLVLLVIDPARLTAEIREEPVPGLTETFPHVYGPIEVEAVVEVRALPDDPSQ